MYLNNFIKAVLPSGVYTNFAGANLSSNTNSSGGGIQNWANAVNAYYTTATIGAYVDVGFGVTPATKNDYKLEISNAVDTPKLTFLFNGYVDQNSESVYPYIRSLTTTYVNNTEEDVTITEVGYAQKGNSGSSINANVLWTRTVLDTPIVVPVGKQVAVTISLEV